MRRVVDLALWLALLSLPALLALAGSEEHSYAQIEREFVETLGFLEPDAEPAAPAESLAPAWYRFFHELQERFGMPGWLGQPLSVGVAWLLFAVAFAVLVAGGLGPLCGAASLLLLLVHPQLRGLGSLMTPWLPAASFTMLGLAFLQGMVLPTVVMRALSPGRWVPRLLAMLGCGLSLGLASSAEERIGWIMLVPGFLLILSIATVTLTLWRIHAVKPRPGFVANPWAVLRRTLPWALCWFLVLVLLVEVHGALQPPDTAALAGRLAAPATFERAMAWLALPGILWLGFREGQILGYRSHLAGSTVLFVCLLALWLRGPALNAAADPLQRILGAPVFAASLASWLRWRG